MEMKIWKIVLTTQNTHFYPEHFFSFHSADYSQRQPLDEGTDNTRKNEDTSFLIYHW